MQQHRPATRAVKHPDPESRYKYEQKSAPEDDIEKQLPARIGERQEAESKIAENKTRPTDPGNIFEQSKPAPPPDIAISILWG
jgi:hypothetical protein